MRGPKGPSIKPSHGYFFGGALLLLLLLFPRPGRAQVFVYPRHADQSPVRYYDFAWRYVDILVAKEGAPGTSVSPPKTGGVRLYFYEREHEVAERASALIAQSYRSLVTQFDYVPTKTFPYILYSSYQEFLQTNLFPIQEGVLGVTSPRDLKLTLPYFGDERMFERVSSHEMAHQFTIQKLRTLSEKAKVGFDPLDLLPLWFVEGLAEYYAMRGIDPETDLFVRDLLINPNLEKGYAMLDFFEDRLASFLWTYKMGQMRCAFLEDLYGTGTLQRILNSSVQAAPSHNLFFRQPLNEFKQLLQAVTGDTPQIISNKFDTWLKRREFPLFLYAKQDLPEFKPLPEFHARTDALSASPTGDLLLYRAVNQDTGRSQLVLMDPRAPSTTQTAAVDNAPGSESLHPGFGRNFEVGQNALVWVAQSKGRDILRWAAIQSHTAQKRQPFPPMPLISPQRPGNSFGFSHGAAEPEKVEPVEDEWDVQLSIGPTVDYEVSREGILAVYSPSLSPDGKAIAFIGLTEAGNRSLYVLRPKPAPHGFALTRLTQDGYAQRQAVWGRDGIVYSSAATENHKFNLFRIRPEAPSQVERLTTEDRDEEDPVALPDGRILFCAFENGRRNLYEVTPSGILLRADVSTGLFDPSPGRQGGLWALLLSHGERRPVHLERNQLLDVPEEKAGPVKPPAAIDRTTLSPGEPYRSLSLENWEIGGVYGFLGGGPFGVFGQLFAAANDRLNNNALLLNMAIFGSLELTHGSLLYVNQEHRLTWAVGPFQALNFRVDQTFPQVPTLFESYERFYGGMGLLHYPFNRFVYVEAELGLGAASYFITPDTKLFLALPEANTVGDLYAPWVQAHQRRVQAEATFRFGYDTLQWNPLAGPIAGNSLLLEATGTYQPQQVEGFGQFRLDAEQYLPIEGRTHFFVRAGAGTSVGGPLAHQFFLSSFDTLRGVPFGTVEWLLGRSYFFSTAELRLPLDAVIRLILFNEIEAVVGADFGGVADRPRAIWDRRVLDYVLGLNFSFGPLVFRLHFAHPVNIGLRDATGIPLYPNGTGNWVTNFSIGLVGMPGFFDRQAKLHAPVIQ